MELASKWAQVNWNYIPHAGQQLDEAAIRESEGNRNIGLGLTPGVEVDTGEHESAESKGAKTKWCRVAEFAVLIRLIERWVDGIAVRGGKSLAHV